MPGAYRICPRSLAAVVVLASLLLVPACLQEAPAQRPNVVLITLDTLRPDFLGFLGNERDTSPFMGRLAESSVLLEEAVSTSSWTAPSTASIFSGVYPNRHRVVAGLAAQVRADQETSQTIATHSIHSALATLPELFSAAGYRTHALVSNPNIRAELGFERGFDRFECRLKASAEDLITTLIEWAPESDDASPYFVYLHLNDAHAPYEPRQPWFERGSGPRENQRQSYISELSYLDSQLERAFEHFGWTEDAVVMIVSDHGEEFHEHGNRYHGFSLFDELSRVLFLFRSPRPGFSPARVAARASLIDAHPTLLELAGVSVPEDLDGRSLVALGDPGRRDALISDLEDRTLLAHRKSGISDSNLWAAMRGPWKMIVGDDGRETQLFNLETDPGEQAGVPADGTDVSVALQDQIRLYRERADSAEVVDASEIELSVELLNELRRLGYVKD